MAHPTQPLQPFTFPPDDMRRRAADFAELMAKRRTVRDFSPRPVDRAIIENCVRVAGTAPSGANQQPWRFVCISEPGTKQRIREAAEAEEREFYAGRAGEEWLDALAALGTDANKPFLETAPWLIVIFAERYGVGPDGRRTKNYYVHESVGIATGFLVTALHNAGLATLTHTPSPMSFLSDICGRPVNEKPSILLAAGYPAEDTRVPAISRKPLGEIVNWIE
ncbi:nitroreductase family protein [Oricola cellulosilytica]|uniref:Nitroreductase family protein n=1 Tax=Oricola cellulosilytica TaxID=1429082 RepID=A0A4R0PE02_9HYPH|nr:nitroreductase family protein [Oricola cellulosilytica]TCD16016.1 nitroreductase family protein [Oricola cellulosilytica]